MVLPDIQPSKIREMHGMAGPGSVNLGLGQPVVETPKELVEVAERVMREDDLGYTGYAGLPELREIIAQDTCGASGDAEQVTLTVGTTQGFFAAMITLLTPGDEVLLPDPGFVLYKAVVRIANGVPVFYPTPPENDFRVAIDDIEARVTPRTKAVVLNSPNNPTGQIIRQETLGALKDLAERSDFYILSDEVYNRLTYGVQAPSSWGASDRVLVFNGISKMFAMTGWRLGWIVGPSDIIKKINTAHHYMVACAPAVAQRVLLRLYGEDMKLADSIRADLHREFTIRRDTLIARIEDQLGWAYVTPEGALYLMLKIPGELLEMGNSEYIARDLVDRQDVITIPGSAFGTQGEGYLRLSFAVDEDTLRTGISRIRKYAAEGARV
ncbi:MAG TPA: aminotransferase class I/II-fold pyridoxal phosphate-dependent enzyme [bacterium]|nr:aminotransferase class I/II-fold pyridoxal phosphate-dependent enzyme [bacterium]